ncbi:MAG: CHASE2 domain-containing protein [Burkholderiales bacterium]
MRAKRASPKRRQWIAGGYAVLLGIILLVAIARLGSNVALALLDAQLRSVAELAQRATTPEVVVVAIDESTRATLREPLALWHAHLGRLLEALAAGRPVAVGLDVLFPERSFDDLIPGHDLRLLRGIVAARAATRLVIGRGIDEDGAPRNVLPAVASLLGPGALGFVTLPVDADNVIRRFSERQGEGGAPIATLAGAMARAAGAPDRPAGLIDYALGPKAPPISMKTVLDWHAAGDAAALRRAFAGKLVLVGSVARFEDRFRQPVNLAPWEAGNGNRVPGVLVHAQILRSLMDRGPILPLPAWQSGAAALMASLLWFLAWRGWAVLLGVTGVAAGIFIAGCVLLGAGVHLDVFLPLLAATGAIVGRWMLEASLHLRERRDLKRTFSGYVGPQLLREILSGRVPSGMVGELRTVAILFADMRGFTSTSATLAPPQVIALLNRYFERAAGVIHTEGGMLNSIMGDGLMAIFGAPKALANPAAAAVATAKRLLAMLPALNAELATDGLPKVAIGIGVHLGEAVVGHVGARARHEYSAIGDTTNTAARLEQLTKDLGVPMVCSRAVAEALGFPPELRPLGVYPIRGRGDVEVFGLAEDSLN